MYACHLSALNIHWFSVDCNRNFFTEDVSAVRTERRSIHTFENLSQRIPIGSVGLSFFRRELVQAKGADVLFRSVSSAHVFSWLS